MSERNPGEVDWDARPTPAELARLDEETVAPARALQASAHLEFDCQALCSHAAQVSRV
jgi:hypothetical protein